MSTFQNWCFYLAKVQLSLFVCMSTFLRAHAVGEGCALGVLLNAAAAKQQPQHSMHAAAAQRCSSSTALQQQQPRYEQTERSQQNSRAAAPATAAARFQKNTKISFKKYRDFRKMPGFLYVFFLSFFCLFFVCCLLKHAFLLRKSGNLKSRQKKDISKTRFYEVNVQ